MTMNAMHQRLAEALKEEKGQLLTLIEQRLGITDKEELGRFYGYLIAYMGFVPVLMQAASTSSLGQSTPAAMENLLNSLERYFLDRDDFIAERGAGLVGLLDDAYLAIRLLQFLNIPTTDPKFGQDALEKARQRLGELIDRDIVSNLDMRAQQTLERFYKDPHKELMQAIRNMGRTNEPDVKGPSPSPKPSISQNVDERLLGTWYKTSYRFIGDISYVSQICRIFGPDGRFVESTEVFADVTYHNAQGDWSGWDTMTTRLPPRNRGTWQTHENQLRLDWDDNTYSEYQYEYGKDGLLLLTREGNSQLWTRT